MTFEYGKLTYLEIHEMIEEKVMGKLWDSTVDAVADIFKDIAFT